MYKDLKNNSLQQLLRLSDTFKDKKYLAQYIFSFIHTKNASDIMHFELYFLMNENGKTEQKLVTLKAVCGPGDDGEPVITIMKTDED